MENKRTIILVASLFVMLTPAWLFAYEPNTTHDALTHEAVNFYNMFAPEYGTPVLSNVERALVQKGAMGEDDSYRMAHHFYDPVHNKGLKLYMSSKTWAESPSYQASWRNGPGGCMIQPHLTFPLYESPCDYSWQRAIYDYAYGDTAMKARAMEALGHTLHLIEDASVPDHTRNDAHIPIFDSVIQGFDEDFSEKSPFEGFTDQFSLANNNVYTTKQLIEESGVPYTYYSLGRYFDNAATYSNSNFFSKSTIFDSSYLSPTITEVKKILVNGKTHEFGFYNQHLLVEQLTQFDQATLKRTHTYTITDDEKYILSAYWQLTSRDAVKNAAGVIRLFFEEVEKEKLTHALRDNKRALLQQASIAGIQGIGAVGKMGSRAVVASIRGVGVAGRFASLGVSSSLFGLKFLGEQGRDGVMLALGSLRDTLQTQRPTQRLAITPTTNTQGLGEDVSWPPIVTQAIPTTVSLSLANTRSGLIDLMRRLTEARGALSQLATVENRQSATIDKGIRGEVLGVTTVTAPYVFQANSFGGGGGGDNNTTIIFLADASVVVPPVTLLATTTTEIIPIDVTAPAEPVIVSPTENSTQVSTSVTVSGSAEPAAIVALSWLADTTTVVFETRATTSGAWSADVLIPLGTTTIGAVAVDDAGNISLVTLRTIVVTLPVVVSEAAPPAVVLQSRVLFSEIAWGGTDASPADEWIEFYNAGNGSADLSHYRLDIGTGTDKISFPLSGTIDAGAYFVVRSNNLAVIVQGGSLDNPALQLPDTEVELTLVEVVDDIDVVRDHIPACADWCGKGSLGTSMERWRTEGGAHVWENWDANDGNFMSGLDRDGSEVYGTPGVRNSLNYQLSLTNTILGMQSFAKEQGEYVIFSTLTIPPGSSLTLGPGTTVKWVSSAQLVVRGALVAGGTHDQPVVFTALGDDSAGGDTLSDGVTPVVRNSTQAMISLSGASSSALLIETEIRHASTALKVENRSSTTLLHTTISDSRNGVLSYASFLSSEDSTFRNIDQNVLVTFDRATSTLASTTIARIGGNVFDIFNSTLTLASTSFTQVSRGSIDAFGSSVVATDTTIDEVLGSNHAIGLFASRGIASTGVIDGLTVFNLGSGEGLYISGSRATVTDAFITGSSGNGVTLLNNATLSLASSTVTNNGNSAILVFGSTLHAEGVALTDNKYGIYGGALEIEIHDSIITGSVVAGIWNDAPTVGLPVDATGNYWGDVDGPTLPGLPPGTAGDRVTLGVVTTPFLTTSPE